MNRKEKKKIITFAREGFRQFYTENHYFLEDADYKPGKKMYRNMTALNKMMDCYLDTSEDYIIRDEVKTARGWDGPSTYAQYERIITNFGLSDTSWDDRDRSVLLLNEKGISLRDKYIKYVSENPDVDLSTMTELPDFARMYLVDELRNTTSQNMTLWKNVLLTALYLYAVLGQIPRYTLNQPVPDYEKEAFIKCCNYVSNGQLMDVSYFSQPAHMLRNLKILDENYDMTDAGYMLMLELKVFKEVCSAISDYEEVFGNEVDVAEEILDSKVELIKVDPPERYNRIETNNDRNAGAGPRNRDFEKSDKKNKITGNLGEKLVLCYERAKLLAAGIVDVDQKLILTSEDPRYGNAYPCDIISVDPATGNKVFIEVKTTRYAAESPFYLSEEERKFSEENASQYRLYRVFDAVSTRAPKFYEVDGYIGNHFALASDRYIVTRENEE